MRSRNSPLSVILIISLVVGVLIALSRFITLPQGIGDIDFVQYWSSTRVLLKGENPYDPVVLEKLQRQVVPTLTQVTRMWNPPAMLAIAIPISMFPFEWARSLWWLIQVTLIVAIFFVVSDLLTLTAFERRWGMVLLLSSASVYNSLGYGQLPPVLLLGWVGFLTFTKSRPFTGGLLLALTLLKPHLLFLNYLMLAISRCWRLLAGAFVGCAVLTIIPTLIQPDILTWYLEVAGEPPIYWFTASLGAWSQFVAIELGFASSTEGKLIFRFLPSFLSGIALLFIPCSMRRITTQNMIVLAPWSLAFSPYGWIYDQLLLLPTIVLIMRDSLRAKRHLSLMLLLASGLVELFTPAWFGQSVSAWYPIFVGMLAWRSRES